MGYDANRYKTANLTLRVESGKLLSPMDVGAKIENFVGTSEGTLLSVNGPCPYLPDYGSGYFDYGNPHGIFHAVLNSSTHMKDVLLCHTGDSVRVFEGFNRSWRNLIGTGIAQINAVLPDDTSPRYPTQFEATPTGIIIVPQGHDRAYFYDGTICLPLGYSTTPPAPTGIGPETVPYVQPGPTVGGPNSRGYYGGKTIIGDNTDFGHGRMGTVQSDVTGVLAGLILTGSYQGGYQWIDAFGNLSPVSGRSNVVMIDDQRVATLDADGNAVVLDDHLKMVLWSNIQPGPTGTIGRVFSRTKDMNNTGTADLFEVSGNATYGTSGSFATIPDNAAEKWPDNVPDSWLFTRPQNVMPVPQFRLCKMAFGRNWIAGVKGNPSAIIPSVPGRWGTFLAFSEEYPDPSGGEPTGLWTVMGGLIVTTLTSTFLVTPGVDGTWIKSTLHPTIGSVAPGSFQNLPDGTTVWLSREGFVRYTPPSGTRAMSLVLISEEIRPTIDRMNPGRACQATSAVDVKSKEYRCWFAVDGGVENTLCMIFDYEGGGWRRRNGERPRGVCVTKDHRSLMLMAGYTNSDPDSPISAAAADSSFLNPTNDANGDPVDYTRGVWVLDHEVQSFWPKKRDHRIESAWIEGARSKEGKSAKLVYVWLRETVKDSATIELHRDWRMKSVASYSSSDGVLLYEETDIPAIWGTTRYGVKAAEWCRRRPFWRKVSVYIPDCEVYKIVITTQSRMEFIGLSMDELPQPGSARVGGR